MLIHATTLHRLAKLPSPSGRVLPTSRIAQVVIGLLVAVWFSAVAPQARATEPMPIEYLWQHQPDLGFDWEPPGVSPPLDITATDFESPYAHTRLRAAQTALRLAIQSREQPELLQAIMKRLQSGETQPYVRAAYVAAACAIGDA